MTKAVRRDVLLALVALGDLAIFAASWLTVFQFCPRPSAALPDAFLSSTWSLLLFIAGGGAWCLVHQGCGLYNSRRLSSGRAHINDAMRAAVYGLVAACLPIAAFYDELLSTVAVPVFFLVAAGLSIAFRLALRATLRRCRISKRNLNHVVFLGANSRALGLARNLANTPSLGYLVLGFVDVDWSGRSEIERSGFPTLSDLEGFADLIRKAPVDEVIICLPMASFYERAQQLARMCEEQGILVRFLADLFRPTNSVAQTDVIAGMPVVTFATPLGSDIGLFIKGVLDRCAALALLVLLSPVFLFVGIAIALTSSGPIFFVQQRLGRNKRMFSLYKFRTMVADAEARLPQLEHLNEVHGAAFKMRDDPRVTSVGRWLRVTSLDELPQLVNVLFGDMSLVGPRPLPRRDWDGLEKDWHRRRFSVRPGISCLWQVSGRHALTFDQWMALDIKYIDNWSLWLDVKILLKTIPAVFKGTGAS